jgi:hypothetical protein
MEKTITEIVARLDFLQPLIIGYIGGSVALIVTITGALYKWGSGVNKRIDELFEQISGDSLKAIRMIDDINSNLGILTTKLNAEHEMREQQKEAQEKLCDERHRND